MMTGLRLAGGRIRLRNGVAALMTAGALGEQPPVAAGDFGLGLIGQSNMFNRQSAGGGTVYPLGHPNATEYAGGGTTGTLRRIGNIGTGTFAGADKWGAPYATYGSNYASEGSQGDGPVMFTGLLAAGLNAKVRVVNRAVGGSSIDSWISIANGGPASGNNWETFAAAVANLATELGTTPAALLRMVVMHQAETDAHSMTVAQWSAKCATVHAQCKALAGNRADFLFGLYALGPGSFNGSLEGEFGKMRVGIIAYATGTPGAFFAGNAYDADTSDGVHIISEGFHRIDRRGAKAALYALGAASAATGRGGNGAGPRIVGATWDGSGVVVTVAHAGGNALKDGSGGAGNALTGFEFKDSAGTVITPAGSGITAPTTMRFPMATRPATVSFGLANFPCGSGSGGPTFNPAACVYDNDGYWQYGTSAPTALGSPLQPCAPITVTGG